MNKTRWITCTVVCAAFLTRMLAAQDVESITLKEAVNRALRNSRDVALAQVRYEVAERTANVNRSAFGPNLYTGSGAAYTYGFPQTPGGLLHPL